MIRALYTSASGMMAQQLNIDNISNNLANVNTLGFKKTRAEFQDLLYSTMRNQTAQVPTGIQVGLGVKPASITTIFTTGNLIQSDNPTDMAIDGNGYFRMINPANEDVPLYTRDGSFKLDGEGNIVNADGLFLDGVEALPEGAHDLQITPEGIISYRDAEGELVPEAGQILLYTFTNPAGLDREGRNMLRETEASGVALEGVPGTENRGVILQKYLESSNVQIVEEMVSMITAQRAYETNTKAIQASDEMLGQANNLKR